MDKTLHSHPSGNLYQIKIMTGVRVPSIIVLVHLVCQHAGMLELCHVTAPLPLLSSRPDVICNFLFCPQFLCCRHSAIALAIDLVLSQMTQSNWLQTHGKPSLFHLVIGKSVKNWAITLFKWEQKDYLSPKNCAEVVNIVLIVTRCSFGCLGAITYPRVGQALPCYIKARYVQPWLISLCIYYL